MNRFLFLILATVSLNTSAAVIQQVDYPQEFLTKKAKPAVETTEHQDSEWSAKQK